MLGKEGECLDGFVRLARIVFPVRVSLCLPMAFRKVESHLSSPSDVRIHNDCPASPQGCQSTFVMTAELEGENWYASTLNALLVSQKITHLTSQADLQSSVLPVGVGELLGRIMTAISLSPTTAISRPVGLGMIWRILKSTAGDSRTYMLSIRSGVLAASSQCMIHIYRPSPPMAPTS